MIPESTLEEIRARISIVDLISEYVSLKKAGQSYTGLCPFHSEKTPSFHVHPQKQCFHCFGCNKGGNIFTFLCSIDGLTFPEAVRKLAERSGIQIPEKVDSKRAKARTTFSPSENRLFDAVDWAAKYFHYLLLERKEYASALSYLNQRGLTEKTLRRFQIGVSPDGWDNLLKQLVRRGFSGKELESAGLVKEREQQPGSYYDRFRNRLMFPIRDAQGKALGFGARTLKDEANQPKYLNSPESALFSKRKTLYGLYENSRGIRLRGEAVLVEGYMDVVGLYEAGVDFALATMGTALTEDHCSQVRALTRRVTTVFDPDKAGTDASKRSIHILLSQGILAKDLQLPEGLDPDEYALKFGSEEFKKLCDSAPRQLTKMLRDLVSQGAQSEEAKAKILEDLTPVLIASRRMPDRATLWDSLSLVLGISVDSLGAWVESAMKRPGAPEPLASIKASSKLPEKSSQIQKPKTQAPELSPVELELFEAALYDPTALKAVPRERWPELIDSKEIRPWVERLSKSETPSDWDLILQDLAQSSAIPELVSLATEKLLSTNPAEKGSPKGWFQAVLARLESKATERRIQNLTTQIKLSQRLGDRAKESELLETIQEIRGQRTH